MIKFKKVNVLGVAFRVAQIAQKELVKICGVDTVMGLCDDVDDSIYVINEIEGRALKRTFVHEWAHAVGGVNGLNQTLDLVTSECMAQSYANAVLELLEQPEVMKFLMAKDKSKRLTK